MTYWRRPTGPRGRGLGKLPTPSKVPPLDRVLSALPPAEAAALRLGAGASVRMVVRIFDSRPNSLEIWVLVEVASADWRRVGVWKRGKIPRELFEFAKTRGWKREHRGTRRLDGPGSEAEAINPKADAGVA